MSLKEAMINEAKKQAIKASTETLTLQKFASRVPYLSTLAKECEEFVKKLDAFIGVKNDTER
jgi:hypothetical protein